MSTRGDAGALPPRVLSRGVELMPGVPLNVYGLHGSEYSVLIDTGIAPMKEALLDLCRELGNVGFVLLTHAHADHMGCNAAVHAATSARFAAAGALPWFEDLERHYREFCLVDQAAQGAPPDNEEQRREIMGLMDGAVHIDLLLEEGSVLRLDDETSLRTLRLPGHKLEEVAFLDEASGRLFMGDVLLALAAPFFHGLETAFGFRASLQRLRELIEAGTVSAIYASHHPPLGAQAALEAVQASERFVDEVLDAVVEAAGGVTQRQLWLEVSKRLGRVPEFRGFAMLQCAVAELVERGVLDIRDGLIGRCD